MTRTSPDLLLAEHPSQAAARAVAETTGEVAGAHEIDPTRSDAHSRAAGTERLARAWCIQAFQLDATSRRHVAEGGDERTA